MKTVLGWQVVERCYSNEILVEDLVTYIADDEELYEFLGDVDEESEVTVEPWVLVVMANGIMSPKKPARQS